MRVRGLIPSIQLLFKKHGSTILSCAAVGGVVATAVAAVKATPKALDILEAAEEVKGEELTNFEKFKVAAPVYIPAVTIGASTIACILGANVLNKRQQAALASMYALADSSYKEYKAKVKEVFGEEGNRKVIQSIAVDKMANEYIEVEEDKVTFMDLYSMRLFPSTMDKIVEAEEVLNSLLQARGYVYLSDYYECLGLAPSNSDDYLGGWMFTSYDPVNGCNEIEFECIEAVDKNGRKCVILDVTEPTADYLF